MIIIPVHSSRSRSEKRARERQPNPKDSRLRTGSGRAQSILLPENDGREVTRQMDGAGGVVRPSVHLSVRRLVVRRPTVGNNDPGRHAIPFGAKGREALQNAEIRPKDGKASVLLPGDIPLDARLLELPASGATHILRASSEPRQDTSSHSE